MSAFAINSPTSISFSGGRTSAYMLWRVLQENNGLPPDAVVCFANTGKEDEATLEFVNRCSIEWGIPIIWLEYQWAEETKDRFKVVSYETASRNGEPFEQLIISRNYLPNPVARFCTVELKVRTMHRYLFSQGWEEWDSMVGIRADEQRRLAKISNQDYGKHEEKIAPLGRVGITKTDVGDFWRSMPFDLGLPNRNGVTVHGNCDLCYLKGAHQIKSLIAEKPERADWWVRMESLALSSSPTGGTFRTDRPNYATMKRIAVEQIDIFDEREESISCLCGD